MREEELEFVEQFFYAPSELDRMGGLWPLRAGRNLAKPNYAAKPRFIECCSIHAVMEGRLYLRSGSGEVILNKGDLFCLFPGITAPYGIAPSDAPLRLIWSAFGGPQAEALLELAGITRERPYVRQAVHAYTANLLQQILHEFKNARSTVSGLRITSLLAQLIGRLIERNRPAAAAPQRTEWMRRSLDYIHAHYAESITVQDVAEYIGIHRSHFSEIFTREVGLPPTRYIQQLRMSRAERLLIDTNASTADIALSLGYPDVYTFAKAFARYYGMPPGRFRAMRKP